MTFKNCKESKTILISEIKEDEIPDNPPRDGAELFERIKTIGKRKILT
jgi:hypothetical protein